jgi:hypothetical protein
MMPRSRPALACLLLAATAVGCSNQMPIEEARLATVVSVGDVTLDGATLEELMLGAPAQARPSEQSANLFVSAFVDAALLRQALIDGTNLTDSTIVREVILPDAILGLLREGMTERAMQLPAVTDAQADSVGRLGSVRVFQQIFFTVNDFTDSLEGVRVRGRLQDALRQLTEGEDFGELARRVSEDSVSRDNGGILPALAREDLPDGPIASTAWRLGVGEYSSPVVSPAGVHLFRRVALVDARPGLRAWLVPRLARQHDTAWLDSVRTAAGVELAPDAVERTRALVKEPFTGGGSAELVTWQGGSLTPARVKMWFSVLSAPERAGLPTASDSTVATFLRTLADRELRFQASGISDPVPPRAWEALSPQLDTAVSSLVELGRERVTDGDGSATVRRFLSDAAAGTSAYRPLPGALGMRLREGAQITINHEALEAITAAAANQYALRQEADSLAALAGEAAAESLPAGP